MNASITAVLGALIVGYFGYKNFTLSNSLKEAQASVTALETSVASAKQQVRKVEKSKDAELKSVRKEMAAQLAKREKLGVTVEDLAAKNEVIAGHEARIDELEAQVVKAREIMQQQKEKLTWYKSEMGKIDDRLTTVGSRR